MRGGGQPITDFLTELPHIFWRLKAIAMLSGLRGNYEAYEADKKRRLGADADRPTRIKYKPLSR